MTEPLQDELQADIRRRRAFLKSVYEVKDKRRIVLVVNATNEEVKLLGSILFFIANGKIPIARKLSGKIGAAQLKFLKEHFEKWTGEFSAEEVRKNLSHLNSALRHLLAPIILRRHRLR